MKYGWLIVGILVLASCASMPVTPAEEEEGVAIQLPYRQAFEKVVNLLKSRGYTIALADKNAGIIETAPKRVSGEEGAVHHNVLFSLLLRGDHRETTAYLRVIVTSDIPDEKKRIIDSLKTLSQ
ncbi:MAG: hypothetical protein L0Y56_19805 [Nitrospira sp.]|nr:hypothetical protein [Nitrospira sp.]